MQEEVESKTLTLIVNSSKFTGRTLKEAIGKYLAHCRAVKLNKARDADALTAAFKEYTQKQILKKEQPERPSVLAKLAAFKELVKKPLVSREKKKEIAR